MNDTGSRPTTADNTLPTPEELQPSVDLANALLAELDRRLLGREALHRRVLTGLLSRGHILLEGMPGVGKTALVKGLGELLGLEFQRVQFTPDLMPGDILGSHILQPAAEGQGPGGVGRRELTFQPGPIFANLLLADEINRASPKTQSALLEAMQERSVTLLGTTRRLPDPFFVLASQNPIELEGTYPLPEAQLDRFLFKLEVGSASSGVLQRIILERRRGEPPAPARRFPAEELEALFGAVERIFLPTPVAGYIARLVAATHPTAAVEGTGEALEMVEKYVRHGASPRAAIALAEASRAEALLAGRPTVGFVDVRAVATAVLNHRLILDYRARLDGMDAHDVVAGLLEQVDEAGMDLPTEVGVAGA